MIEIEPDFYGAYWLKGAIRLAEEQYADAVEELTRAVTLGGHPIVVADLASAYALAARTQDATNILDQLLEKRRSHYVPATCIARVYSRLGETENAIAWLETAFDKRNGEMVFLQEEIAGAADGDPLKRLAIEVTGRVATATLRERSDEGSVIDYFHLLKDTGRWWIVSKLWDAE